MEEKIKALLRYSFYDNGVPVDYQWLTDEESEILNEEDYRDLLGYISDGQIT